MNTKTERIKARNEAIRKDYKHHTGVKHLDSDYTLSVLEKKYHLAADTIWRIVAKIGNYKDM